MIVPAHLTINGMYDMKSMLSYIKCSLYVVLDFCVSGVGLVLYSFAIMQCLYGVISINQSINRKYIQSLRGYLPVCSGGGITVGGCGVGGVSGEVELEMREGKGWRTGYGGDAVMNAGKYEEETGVWAGGTCKYTVGGIAV